jgi:hypothetical protein
MWPEYLVDLDELVLRCRTKQAKAYLGEAVRCYRAGAFRGCIVLTWTTVVYDIMDKLRELAASDDRNAQRQIAEIEKLITENRGGKFSDFEQGLLATARDDFELLAPIEIDALERLRQDRHRCAHPTLLSIDEPYEPSAEQARVHLRNAVVSLLQHPPTQGQAALNRIFDTVQSEYFPTETERAIEILNGTPLHKPRQSLLRNFIRATVKRVFDPDIYHRNEQFVSALNASISMHPAGVREPLQDAFRDCTVATDDPKLHVVLGALREIPMCWDFVTQPILTRLRNYIEKLKSRRSDTLLYALTRPELSDVARLRLLTVDSYDVRNMMFWGGGEDVSEVRERFFELCRTESNGWAINDALIPALAKIMKKLTMAELESVLEAIQSNPKMSASAKLGELFIAIRERASMSPGELFELMRRHHLESMWSAYCRSAGSQ